MADKPLINAGELNIQISIQAEYGGSDSYGAPMGPWADVVTDIYAAMIQEGGREFYQAQKTNAEVTAVFKIWFINGINSRMRIKYSSRYFNILSVDNPEQRNVCLLIAAREVI
jgi:SPP1 family predicted phage head-tail adaptor